MNKIDFKPEGWLNQKININKINEYLETGQTLEGKVIRCDENCNLYVDLGNNINAIIPRTEIEAINVNKEGFPEKGICFGKVNKYVQFKIKKIIDDNTIYLSRKQVQEETLLWLNDEKHEGDIVEGVVKSIQPYGAFVEIAGGVVGLIHIEDLSVARIKSPIERVKIGQKLKVVVKYIGKNNGRINLSYKETLGSWEENANKFKEGMKVKGIIRETEKNKNGIFVELTPNLVGMLEYKEGLTYGNKINVLIKKIDYNKKKVKLAYYLN